MDNNETPISVFLDLSKAFDLLDHNILLYKLKYYGINSNSLQLLENYLTNRKQYIEFEKHKSDLKNITIGVPQGSILGPLFFNLFVVIYINDIVLAPKIFTPIIYADDTTLFSTLEDFNLHNGCSISQNINNDLSRISEWLHVDKLCLNANKSKFMLFHSPNKKIDIPSIEINSTEVYCVDNFNFLGILLDKHLNWKSQTSKIANKISRTIGVLTTLKQYLPSRILLTIYNTLIMPHLNYGILAWGYQPGRLVTLQKKAVRAITSSAYNAHTSPIFKNLRLLKIYDIHTLQQLKFYYKMVHTNLPIYFNTLPLIRNQDIHGHNTRCRNKIGTIRTKHEFAKRCIRYSLAHTINSLPSCIQDKIVTHSLSGLSIYSKQFLLNKYESNCQIINCYICN